MLIFIHNSALLCNVIVYNYEAHCMDPYIHCRSVHLLCTMMWKWSIALDLHTCCAQWCGSEALLWICTRVMHNDVEVKHCCGSVHVLCTMMWKWSIAVHAQWCGSEDSTGVDLYFWTYELLNVRHVYKKTEVRTKLCRKFYKIIIRNI